jgi:hypothetical protein
MRLEHWDSSRRKFVLYRNAEQHTLIAIASRLSLFRGECFSTRM